MSHASSNPLPESQLEALISLLTDRDEAMVRRCRARLIEEGPAARAALENTIARLKQADPEAAVKPFESALRAMRLSEADRNLIEFAADPLADLDLEAGAVLIARTHDPDVDAALIARELDRLAQTVDDRLFSSADEDVVGEAFRSALSQEAGLAGNQADYHDPQNSFLDRVLERRLGIPISLSVVYLLVSQRLGLGLRGVGMPGHFLIALSDSGERFIDPFHKARLLSRGECLSYLERADFGRDESLLAPTPNRYILARMLVNLLNVYRRRKDIDTAERYRRLFERLRGQNST